MTKLCSPKKNLNSNLTTQKLKILQLRNSKCDNSKCDKNQKFKIWYLKKSFPKYFFHRRIKTFVTKISKCDITKKKCDHWKTLNVKTTTKNSQCGKIYRLKMRWNLRKTLNVTKLKNSKCDNTKHTQNVTKLKMWQLKNWKCGKTQKHDKREKLKCTKP